MISKEDMTHLLYRTQSRWGSILLTVGLLMALFTACTPEDRDLPHSGRVSGKIALTFGLGHSDEGALGVSALRATSGNINTTDPTDECYVKDLWIVVFNPDGSLLHAPKNIKSQLDGHIYKFDETLNYGERYTCYFVANLESAEIDMSAITTEQHLKDLVWTIPSGVAVKEVYSMEVLPKIRLMVAKYEIGIETVADGGGIYSQSIDPITGNRATKEYHTELVGKGAIVPVVLHRSYSKVEVVMQRDKEIEEKIKQEGGDLTKAKLYFSLVGFSKSFKLFDRTPIPAEADKHADITHEFNVLDPALAWDNDRTTVTLYFPAGQLTTPKTNKQVIPHPYGSDPIVVETNYVDPCLRITYRHMAHDLSVYVNAKNGALFEQNHNYRLPVKFFSRERNVWLVRMSNVSKETPDASLNFATLDDPDPVTFANSLRCEVEKPYHPVSGNGAPLNFYAKGIISYGNIFHYNTLIETISLGGPAIVANKSELKDWIKDIKEVDRIVLNTDNKFVCRQLWRVNPTDKTPLMEDVLRQDIKFRNKFDYSDDSATEIVVRCHFNVLNKISALNLGELNTFTNGKEMEFDPLTYRPIYTEENEAQKGGLYEFGRNLPLVQHTPLPINYPKKVALKVNLHSKNTTLSGVEKIWNASDTFLQTVLTGKKNSWFYYDPNNSTPVTNSDLVGTDKTEAEKNPWAWIVKKTKELYGAPDSYVGKNDGDPCPPKYYKMPSDRDFQYIIYNHVKDDKSKELPFIQNSETGGVTDEKDMSPGGDPNSTDVSHVFKASYKKKDNIIYALRFIGTKWASVFIYKEVKKKGQPGIELTVYPASSKDYTREEFLNEVAAGTVENRLHADEKQVRFFPFSQIVYSHQTIYYEGESYTSYMTNKIVWHEGQLRVFDIDMQLETAQENLQMATTASATAIRCLRK